MERKLLEAFLHYEEIKRYMERLDRLKERGEIDDDQYQASKEEYEEQLEGARSVLANIRLQLRDAAEDKRSEFEIYQQELKNLRVKLNTGEMEARQYMKERQRAEKIIAQAEGEFNFMKNLLNARSSHEVRKIMMAAGQKVGGARQIRMSRGGQFFTAGRIIALSASLLVVISIILPLVNIPEVGSASLVRISSETGHPVWVYPLVYSLLALAFIFPGQRILRGIVHFAMGVLVVILIVIAVQAVRVEAEAQFADFYPLDENISLPGRMMASSAGVGIFSFLAGLAGISIAGIVELCRSIRGVMSVIITICLLISGSVGHLTFWFGMLKPQPTVSVKVTDMKEPKSGIIKARLAAITITNTGSRVLRLFSSSRCKNPVTDYLIGLQKLNEENGEWEVLSIVEDIWMKNHNPDIVRGKPGVAIRPHRHHDFKITFSPIWDPHGHCGGESKSGTYRVSLIGARPLQQEFKIKSQPCPDDIAKEKLAQAREALKRNDFTGGINILERIPSGTIYEGERRSELDATRDFCNLREERQKAHTRKELEQLRIKFENLKRRCPTAVVIRQMDGILKDVEEEIKEIDEESAGNLLTGAKQLYERAEQLYKNAFYEDALEEYRNTAEKCDKILEDFGDTSSAMEARMLKSKCNTKILEVKAENTLSRARRLIQRDRYIEAGKLLLQEYQDVKRKEFQEQIDRINEWAAKLDYEQFAHEYRRCGDARKATEYEELLRAAESDFKLKIMNMAKFTRLGRVSKEEALKMFRKFLEEYPRSKHVPEVKKYIEELGGKVPVVTGMELFELPGE